MNHTSSTGFRMFWDKGRCLLARAKFDVAIASSFMKPDQKG